MAELYLVRHGQASFGSENYDQLSELGYQQCRWLGEYFRERNVDFDRVIVGGMARHVQSAESICEGLGKSVEFDTHEGFNEFDFKQIIDIYLAENPQQQINDWQEPRAVYGLLRTAMKAWSQGEISSTDLPETWESFHQRVADAMAFARAGDSRRTLVASSGGTISVALSQIMGFDADTIINLNLQTKNSSINHFFYNQSKIYVTSFNNVPHLDVPERLDAVTHS